VKKYRFFDQEKDRMVQATPRLIDPGRNVEGRKKDTFM
jgi:hypothetical protein